MLEQLDPHSTYISLEEIHDMNAPLKGSFSWCGDSFSDLERHYYGCSSYS